MERTMSVEERIRKAEEIYSRRNGQYKVNISNKSTRKKTSNVKKMLMQIFIFLMIYLAFYVFTNSEYIFSEEFLNQVKGIFNQDSKIYSTYLNVKSYIEKTFLNKSEETVENKSETEDKNEQTNINEASIGGAEEIEQEEQIENTKEEEKKEEIPQESNKKESAKNKSQMERDADDIKKSISFINPIKGRISSTFGWRTPTTDTVPKNHTGLDIAAETGTIIKSATDGEVILASPEGDYGNHYKIQNKDVIIIYAHCSKLYLKQGDKVKQGDKIAEVGSTGNSTGPHLHFEIRKGKEQRLVDPQLILDI
ncbi:MAG: M23 family metallopeptidase [Clostridia bacterium]|nr:M23 family metallopeptidase [Clostridia bacterium]